jgi:hypothetical protein
MKWWCLVGLLVLVLFLTPVGLAVLVAGIAGPTEGAAIPCRNEGDNPGENGVGNRAVAASGPVVATIAGTVTLARTDTAYGAARVSQTKPAADDPSCGETSNGDMGGAIKLVAELNPAGAGNWQGAVKAGGYWFVAHARRGDRVAIFHRLSAAGREVDQMTVTGGQMHPTGFAVIGNTIYAAYGTSVVTFGYRPEARIGKSGTRPTGWQGEISAAPDGRTAVLRQGNRYRQIMLGSGVQTGHTVRTPPGARQGFSVLGNVLYVLTGATNRPARVDTFSFKTGRRISTRSVTGVGFRPGEKRSFREPEGMWGNLMGVKVKNGDARRLRVYSIADGFSGSGKIRRVTSQGKSYRIPIPTGRAGRAINFALDQLGDRYVWAAHGPDAWDCSGLTGGAWIHAGVRIPQQSDAQRASLRHVPTSQMRPGDILWHPGHVQLYLGIVAGKRTVVEAANPRVPVRIDQTGWMDIQAVLRP